MPTGWKELSQKDLRYCLRLLWLYGEAPDWQERVGTAAFLYFCHVEVAKRTDKGWLCREQTTGKNFILDPELLPSILERIGWLTHTDKICERIEQVGQYKAVDFELHGLIFGNYLMADNFYQAYLAGRQTESLVSLAMVLYNVPDEGDVTEFCDEVLTGAFLWFAAAKNVLGKWFPNFLKPAGDNAAPVTMENQQENTQAQIRLLTKGDVTKQEYILKKTDTWTALAELDALAREAEEIKRKYGK